MEVLINKYSRAALVLLKAVTVFLDVRFPNSAGILHDRCNECGIALDPIVSIIIVFT